MPADPLQTHVVKSFANEAPLVSCRFDPAGRFVFVGQQSAKVARWDLTTGMKTDFEGGHESWVRAIAFVNKGETLLTGGHDGRLIWWPALIAEKPAPLRTVEAHAGWIRAIDISPDGRLIATCGNDLKVKLWKADDGTLVREFAGHERHVYNVAFHPGGKNLLSGDLIGNFIDWEVDTGKQLRAFKVPTLHKYDPSFMADYGGPYSLQFAKDGKQFGAGGITNVSNAFAGVGNPALCMVDWESGKETMAHLAKANVNGKVFGLAIHPEGHLIGGVGGAEAGTFTSGSRARRTNSLSSTSATQYAISRCTPMAFSSQQRTTTSNCVCWPCARRRSHKLPACELAGRKLGGWQAGSLPPRIAP